MTNLSCIGSSHFFVFHVLLLHLFCSSSFYAHAENKNLEQKQLLVPVGVVLDLNSTFGSMVNLCMDMSISDFYSLNSNYKTRLQLHKKDAKSLLDANFAVLELVKHEQVLAILGPQGSVEEAYVAQLGENVHVPVVSFTARSSSLSKNRYFVRTTLDDAVQAQALAAVCQRFEWPEVVILYEDTEYGNHFLSRLIKAFQNVDITLAHMISIPTSAEDSHILEELNRTKKKPTNVFLVHMNPVLGGRLFTLANSAGMMSEGYAWIITDSLSIDTDSMDGVLGLRPNVLSSKNLKSFQERWKRNQSVDLNIYGLWAYDAVTALAIAVENIRDVDLSSLHVNGTDKTGLRISSSGPRLIDELSNTTFRGLAGDFHLVDGKLKPSAFEIFNVIGNGERIIGFWTPNGGITREPTYSTSTKELKKVVWPGDSLTQPKGRTITAMGSLRVGVPWKPGFKEFVNVRIDPATNETNASGFAIDIFRGALNLLPFPINYTFLSYNDSTSSNWSYDSMLQKIPQEYDMVVADVTIWAPRALYVDFSLPYSESGVVLVVKNKKPFDMWTFIRPLRWDLWLAILVACILMGIILGILERRATRTGQDSHAARQPGTIYWSPIAILAFQERNMVLNNWSVFVLVCWLFMAFILMQSFTANLSAILTVDQLKFAFSEDYYVGYHEGSFMKSFLTDRLSIKESRLRPYSTAKGFHEAMSKGSKNGGIDAIFDEVPYMKLLLNRYAPRYKIVGPTYRTDGLGFAFPVGSPLVAHFSRAILNVTQGPTMNYLEQKNFGPGYSSQDPLNSIISQGTSSLTFHEFAGLFLLIGLFTLFAVFCSETSIGRKLCEMTGHFVQCCFGSEEERIHSMESDTSVVGGDNDAQVMEDEAQHDAQVMEDEAPEMVETGLDNHSRDAPDAGIGTHDS